MIPRLVGFGQFHVARVSESAVIHRASPQASCDGIDQICRSPARHSMMKKKNQKANDDRFSKLSDQHHLLPPIESQNAILRRASSQSGRLLQQGKFSPSQIGLSIDKGKKNILLDYQNLFFSFPISMGGIHDDPDIGVDVARNECATETLNSKYFYSRASVPSIQFII